MKKSFRRIKLSLFVTKVVEITTLDADSDENFFETTSPF